MHHPALLRGVVATDRILLGLLFVITGINGFLQFLPQPAGIPQAAADFSTALVKTGYMFPLVMATQFLFGILLLANRLVPFALVLIAPVIVNIVAFHIFLFPAGSAMAIVAVALYALLLWVYRGYYRILLTIKAQPSV